MNKLKQIIEALIFAAETPISLERLCQLVEQPKAEIRPIVAQLMDDFSPAGHGFYLAEVAGGYQFRTGIEQAPWLQKLRKERPFRFSQAALETLAIIAYRQPVTRAEIEYLRGVDSGGVVKNLLEKGLLKILGKKDVPGRPMVYGTSRHFLEMFGLRDLSDLPTLKEFNALNPGLAEAIPRDPEPLEPADG